MLKKVSNMETGELFDKFKLADLQGKLANICTDIDTSKVLDMRFKKIVDGAMQAVERKNKDPYEFRPHAKILFSANDYMPTRDKSHAFFRRFDLVIFEKIFEEADQDPHLVEKLTTKESLQGVFNWSLVGLRRLMAQNWKMTKSEEVAAAMAEFKSAANPLKQFVDDYCQVAPGLFIDTDLFRKSYLAWCESKGYEPMSDNKLGREMKRLGFSRNAKMTAGKRYRTYVGIAVV